MNKLESVETLPITIEILEEKIKEFRDKYFTEERNKNGFAAQEANSMVENFIDELLSEKEKFSKIFKTEKGSIYFVLEDGHSLRFKFSMVGVEKIRPIKEKVFFISNTVANQLVSSEVPLRAYINKEIPLVEYGIGATPLELNRITDPIKTIYKETPDFLIMTSSREENGEVFEDVALGSYHFGHPISEIIK